ncbi:hypothetical protein AGMMS49982_14790 [Bacteroidia bacterium]|nr:hypothetical protein AGMMS49982_14790 [Bacteroidia bacterium]
METFLHHVWKHRLYAADNFKTAEGQTLEVINPGIYNTDAGPDFFNAKIRLDGQVWAGNIEIHNRSSDWYRHCHDTDKAYNSTVLHIVEVIDHQAIKDSTGRLIPQWVMPIPECIYTRYSEFVKMDNRQPCLDKIKNIPEIFLSDWQTALLLERLNRKTQDIMELLKTYKGDWNTVFYITLARNFGFGINNDAFERLAKSLPLSIVNKHSHSCLQIEALFLGQAGLLDETDIDDKYQYCLRSEYRYLQQMYDLQPLEGDIFKRMRLRPNNFPHIKIVQLSGFIQHTPTLFSKVLDTHLVDGLRKLFESGVSPYWETHYNFKQVSEKRQKVLGQSAIDILLINTVAPIVFAYGHSRDEPFHMGKTFRLLQDIPAEHNSITHPFVEAGLKTKNAGDSQALIQLKKEYCDQKKCMFCRIGHQVLSKEL